MRYWRRGLLIISCVVIGLPITSGAAPTFPGPRLRPLGTRVDTTPKWGTSISAWGGNPAGGSATLYGICDATASRYPATPKVNCYGGAAPVPVRSLSANISVAYDGPGYCPGAGPGTCGAASIVGGKLGALTDSGKVWAGPRAGTDTAYTGTGLADENAWNDVMTVSSTKLPVGTLVAVRALATVTVAATQVPCKDAGLNGARYVASPPFGGYIDGTCSSSGTFVFSGYGDTAARCVKSGAAVTCTVAVTTQEAVGYSVPISSYDYIGLQVSDCAIASCYGSDGNPAYGNVTAQIENTVLTVKIAPVTSGVSLRFASGNSGY